MTVEEAGNFLDTFLLEVGEEKRVDIVLVPPFTALAARFGAAGEGCRT